MINFNTQNENVNLKFSMIVENKKGKIGKSNQRLKLIHSETKLDKASLVKTTTTYELSKSYQFAVSETKPLLSWSWKPITTPEGKKIWVNIHHVAKKLGVQKDYAKEVVRQLSSIRIDHEASEAKEGLSLLKNPHSYTKTDSEDRTLENLAQQLNQQKIALESYYGSSIDQINLKLQQGIDSLDINEISLILGVKQNIGAWLTNDSMLELTRLDHPTARAIKSLSDSYDALTKVWNMNAALSTEGSNTIPDLIRLIQTGQPIKERDLKTLQQARAIWTDLQANNPSAVALANPKSPNYNPDNQVSQLKFLVESHEASESIRSKSLLDPAHRGTRGAKDETLTAQEYELLTTAPHYAPELAIKSGDAVKSINMKLPPYVSLEIERVNHKIKNRETLNIEDRQVIVAAKEIWRDMQMNEGSTIHLDSFADQYDNIGALREVAHFNDKGVDELLFNKLSQNYLSNKPASPIPTVIVGAGPTGLMAAFKLFEAGRSPKIYEGRVDAYNRSHILILDPKLTAQMQYYLGSDYDKLKEQGALKLREDGVTEVVIQDFEKALSKRFNALIEHVKTNALIEKPELNYQHSVLNVQNGKNGKEVLVKNHAKTIAVPYKHLILAGGSGKGNEIRDLHLGPAVKQTQKKGYGVAVINQSQVQNIQGYRGTISTSGHLTIPLREMNRQFNNLPVKQRSRLGSLWSEASDSLSNQNIEYRQFENKNQYYVAFELPNQVISFQKQIQKLKAEYQNNLKEETSKSKRKALEKSLKQLEDFEKNFKEQTFTALASELGIKPSELGPFKYQALFPVAQKVVSESVKEEMGTVISVIGDAGASPHFFSGSGQSSARKWEDDLAKFARDWNKSPEQLSSHVDSLRQNNQKTIEYTLHRGKDYVNPLDQNAIQQKEKKAVLRMLKNDSNFSSVTDVSISLPNHTSKNNTLYKLSFDYKDSSNQVHQIYLEKRERGFVVQVSNQQYAYSSIAEALAAIRKLL